MSTADRTDVLVDRYLSDLDAALRGLPAARRQQIIDEITEHISEGRSGLQHDDEVGLRELLDRVGDPDDIAVEEAVDYPRPRTDAGDAWVPWLLLFGGFAFGVGWFVGVALLWWSKTWSVRDKLLGTLIIPGGLASLFIAMGGLVAIPARAETCTASGGPLVPTTTHCTQSGSSLSAVVAILVAICLLLAPILVAVHLERVRRRA